MELSLPCSNQLESSMEADDSIPSLQSKTFHVVYKNIPAAFTIDWTDGFLLKPFASPTFHFVYGFSQLKGSSDDGKATLTLQFQEARRPGMKPNLIKEEVTD